MATGTKVFQNKINHIALVLDASSSMEHLRPAVIKVADAQIAHLAERSKELNMETRITVYTFADATKCVVYDMDVLRLPSIAEFYTPYGWTALMDATVQSQLDLGHTWEGYGDHSYFTIVITDGLENKSKLYKSQFSPMIKDMKDNWTLAFMVPDMTGKSDLKMLGVPADNIAIWDATSTRGMEEAGSVLRTATDNYMTGRTVGVRGSRSVFNTGEATVNKETITSAGLKPLDGFSYYLIPVVSLDKEGYVIKAFIEGAGIPFKLGRNYYELSKTELIQPQKEICILETKTGKVYSGRDARALLGLPDMVVRVKPDFNRDYKIFVQSTSVNRNLVPHTKLLILK